MKKYLFLSFLIFCATIMYLGNSTISISLHLSDQDEFSKTKEITEIYTSNTLLDTEEIKKEETIQDVEKAKEEEIAKDTEKNVEIKEEKSKENSSQNNTNKINTKTTEKKEMKKIETPTYEEKKSNYEFLRFSNDISLENIRTAENEISKLPKKIVDSFIKEKWNIEITNENIAKKFFGGAYKSVIGVTVTASKEIYLQNKKSSIQSSLIHEIGHYLDWYFDYPSAYNNFKQIYNEEVNTFKSRITNSSCVSNEMEFFAHTFYYYIKDSSKCTPKALEFVKSYVSNI